MLIWRRGFPSSSYAEPITHGEGPRSFHRDGFCLTPLLVTFRLEYSWGRSEVSFTFVPYGAATVCPWASLPVDFHVMWVWIRAMCLEEPRGYGADGHGDGRWVAKDKDNSFKAQINQDSNLAHCRRHGATLQLAVFYVSRCACAAKTLPQCFYFYNLYLINPWTHAFSFLLPFSFAHLANRLEIEELYFFLIVTIKQHITLP